MRCHLLLPSRHLHVYSTPRPSQLSVLPLGPPQAGGADNLREPHLALGPLAPPGTPCALAPLAPSCMPAPRPASCRPAPGHAGNNSPPGSADGACAAQRTCSTAITAQKRAAAAARHARRPSHRAGVLQQWQLHHRPGGVRPEPTPTRHPPASTAASCTSAARACGPMVSAAGASTPRGRKAGRPCARRCSWRASPAQGKAQRAQRGSRES